MSIAASVGLTKAKVPILLIYGESDELVNAKATIARAKQLNPQIQSKLYANSGHAPFIEESVRFNRDLSHFIDAALAR